MSELWFGRVERGESAPFKFLTMKQVRRELNLHGVDDRALKGWLTSGHVRSFTTVGTSGTDIEMFNRDDVRALKARMGHL